MGLLMYMITAAVNLIIVAIDLAVLLIIVRLLNHWRPNKILTIIDKSAKSLVDALMDMADRVWTAAKFNRQLSDKGKLLLALSIITTGRFLIIQTYLVLR